MNAWARRGLVALGSIVVVAAVAGATGVYLAQQKMTRTVEVTVVAVPLPAEPERITHGKYLFETRGCTECHGLDGGGKRFIDDGAFQVSGPQISRGRNSATSAYRVQDWVRAIRHGVDPSGRPLIIMPSEDYNRLSDADLGALIAYIRQLPEVEGQPRLVTLPLPVRALYGFGAITDAAAKIDHLQAPQPASIEGASIEHGRYVAQMCVGCHGEGMSGGKVPGGPPDWPAAANLTPGNNSAMVRYPDAKAFAAMFRGGKRPDGTPIAVMPFDSLRKMSDTDLAAIHAFLKTLPARPAGER